MVALIPARAGSKRVPGKNTRPLGGHPLLAYAIAAARHSGLFDRVIVSSEDPRTLQIADAYGAEAMPRDAELAGDRSPDILWIRDVLSRLSPVPVLFAILRPTSPFRTERTIRAAWRQFEAYGADSDSLRAVERVTQHPYKMWISTAPPGRERESHITPLHPGAHPDGTPWHSSATQSLAPIYIQNSSLEISRTANVTSGGTISGTRILPFFTEGYEGLTIDAEADWWVAERIVAEGIAALPAIDRVPA